MRASGLSRRRFAVGAGLAVAGSRFTRIARVAGHSKSDDDGGPTRPSIIAHRGFGGVYPENTVHAARLSSGGDDTSEATHAHDSVEMIEIDVLPTADGDVVVFHDERLHRGNDGGRGLTDASGVVWETPTETVHNAEVLDSGETVPLLDELLAVVPDPVGVMIEFKNPGTADIRFGTVPAVSLDREIALWRSFTETVLSIVGKHENPVLITSLYEAAIASVREIDPSIPVAYMFWNSIPDGLAVMERYDCEVIEPPRNMIKHTPFFGNDYYTSGPFLDVDLVEIAHSQDRAVYVYTVETPWQAAQLACAGVDGLLADYPRLLPIG